MCASPILENHTAILDPLNAACANLLPLRILYVPFTYPEIELLVFRLIQTGFGKSVAKTKQLFEPCIFTQTCQIRISVQFCNLAKPRVHSFSKPLKSFVLIIKLCI